MDPMGYRENSLDPFSKGNDLAFEDFRMSRDGQADLFWVDLRDGWWVSVEFLLSKMKGWVSTHQSEAMSTKLAKHENRKNLISIYRYLQFFQCCSFSDIFEKLQVTRVIFFWNNKDKHSKYDYFASTRKSGLFGFQGEWDFWILSFWTKLIHIQSTHCLQGGPQKPVKDTGVKWGYNHL